MNAIDWPRWACDEDGEYVWIRSDIAHAGDAAAVPEVREIVEGGGHGYHLVHEYDVLCSLDVKPNAWTEWLVHEVKVSGPGDDVRLYSRYIITDNLDEGDVEFVLAQEASGA